jgi:hypothetical protein
MKRVLLTCVVVALASGGIGGWWVVAHANEARGAVSRPGIDRDTMRLVPADLRVKIEVLNATGERGLARRAMHYLRDRGFDVVSVGNASERSDSSVVYDRSGHPAWAALAARALGPARVESRPDPSRYLDLTLVLGASFRPPAQILYP